MENKHDIRKLDVLTIYKNSLWRNGFIYIEDVEEYLNSENSIPLSVYTGEFSTRGDYLIADAVHFYRHGTHIEKPMEMALYDERYNVYPMSRTFSFLFSKSLDTKF